MDEDYVCTLDADTEKKAIRELNEVPTDRLKAVQCLRDWLHEQPHIKFTDETSVLLSFLRGAKFSQLRAREMIQGYLMMRNQTPRWFKNIDSRDPVLLDVIRKGYAVPLPKRDPNGCQILLYRIGNLDASTKRVGVAEELRASMIVGRYIGRSELTQVNGSVFIFDFTGLTAKHMARWSVDDMSRWSKLWQNNFPGRYKAFHYYNTGSFLEALMTLVKPFMKKKFQERVHIHQTLESLYKYLPAEYLPSDYLPDDYQGPSQGQLKDIIENYISHVTTDDFRNELLRFTGNELSLDESKMKRSAEEEGFYRKLNVD